jgi:hypothetical protein
MSGIPRYMSGIPRYMSGIPRYMSGISRDIVLEYEYTANMPQIYRGISNIPRDTASRETRYEIYRGISIYRAHIPRYIGGTILIYRGILAVYRGILAVYRGILAVYLISRRYPVSPSVHIPSIYRHIPSYTVHIPSIYRRYTEPFRHRVAAATQSIAPNFHALSPIDN